MSGAESSICEILEGASGFEVSDAGAETVEELKGDSWVGAAVEGLGNGILVRKLGRQSGKVDCGSECSDRKG